MCRHARRVFLSFNSSVTKRRFAYLISFGETDVKRSRIFDEVKPGRSMETKNISSPPPAPSVLSAVWEGMEELINSVGKKTGGGAGSLVSAAWFL